MLGSPEACCTATEQPFGWVGWSDRPAASWRAQFVAEEVTCSWFFVNLSCFFPSAPPPPAVIAEEEGCPWVSDLTLLQVLDELSQPAFCGGVILQDLGEGGVLQLVRKALPESFTCPTSRDK